MSFKWDEKLNIGISDIDEQHKNMFEAIYRLNIEDLGFGKKTKILHDLKDYVIVHFATEEDYMRKFEYPDYENHKAWHENFTKEYNKLLLRLAEELSLKQMRPYLSDLLNSWVNIHYKNADIQMANFLKERL